MLVPRHLQDSLQAAHVHMPGQTWVPLPHRGQDRRQVVDDVGVVTHGRLADSPGIGGVQHLEGAGLRHLRTESADIGGEDGALAVQLAELRNQPGADLPAGPGDEYAVQGRSSRGSSVGNLG